MAIEKRKEIILKLLDTADEEWLKEQVGIKRKAMLSHFQELMNNKNNHTAYLKILKEQTLLERIHKVHAERFVRPFSTEKLKNRHFYVKQLEALTKKLAFQLGYTKDHPDHHNWYKDTIWETEAFEGIKIPRQLTTHPCLLYLENIFLTQGQIFETIFILYSKH